VGHFRDFVENSVRGDMSKRLAALQHVKQFLDDDAKVVRRADRFLKEAWPQLRPDFAQRIAGAGSGKSFYLSEPMSDYAAVHDHYERLGALIKLHYIEFSLIYEIIDYPDEYMAATADVEAALVAHWKGPNRPLKDFGANIRWLRRCYEHSRKLPPGHVADCPDS